MCGNGISKHRHTHKLIVIRLFKISECGNTPIIDQKNKEIRKGSQNLADIIGDTTDYFPVDWQTGLVLQLVSSVELSIMMIHSVIF